MCHSFVLLQFWNALVRKGKTDGASEEDMDTVIAVHNNMNETTWRQVIIK